MSGLDQEFNKRFQFKKSTSDSVEMEELWAAVEGELDEESKDRDFLYFFGAFGGLIVLISISYWIFRSYSQNTELESVQLTYPVQASSDFEDELCLEYLPIDKESIAKSKSGLTKIGEVETALKEVKTIAEVSSTLIQRTQEGTKQGADLKVGFSKNSYAQIFESVREQEEASVSEEKISTPVNGNTGSVVMLFIPNKKLDFEKDRPKLLEISERLLFKNVGIDNTKEGKEQRSINFTIGINGGINRNIQKYKNADTAGSLKNATENGEVGQTYGLQLGAVLQNRWLLQTGVEYHNYWSKFEYRNSQVEEILKEDQLVRVWLNGTDTLRREFSDVSVNRRTTREVIHHNNYRQISIPIEFGWKKRKGKIAYGATAGTSLNFMLTQSGKAFNEASSIIEYDNNSSYKPLKDFGLGFRFSPFAGYYLTDKIMLGLKPNLTFLPDSGTSLSSNTLQYSLRVGIQAEF